MIIEELEQKLNNNQLDSIYLLYGEETFLLEKVLKKIKKIFGELIQGINYITVDETNINDLIANIETPAFGYEKKLIIVKGTELFKKTVRKKNEELNEEFEEDTNETLKKMKQTVSNYLEDNFQILEQGVVLIFIQGNNIEKAELYKSIEKNGIVCNFEKKKLPDLVRRIRSIANAYEVSIDDYTTKYFLECCGTNLQDLINEIRKLIEYTGPKGTITKEIIDLLSTKQMESVVFDLTDSLGQKNVKSAIDILDELIYNKEPIQKILIILYNHIKKLYITKISEQNKKNLATSLNLKPNQLFLTGRYKEQARRFDIKELRAIMGALIDLDANYKLGLIDLRLGLESILCGYCS